MYIIPLSRNTDFLVCAILLCIVMIVTTRHRYDGVSKANKAFYRILYVLLASSFADLALNIAETYTGIFPPVWSVAFRFLYNCAFGILSVLVYQYIRSYTKKDDNFKLSMWDYFITILAISDISLGIVNIFTGVVNYIDENGVSQEGPLHIFLFVVPLAMILITMIVLIRNRAAYTRFQFNSVFALVFILLFFISFEALSGTKILLCMFGVALGMVVFLLTLETPEYVNLVAANRKIKEGEAEIEKLGRQFDILRGEAEQAQIAHEASEAELADFREGYRTLQNNLEEARRSEREANMAKTEFLSRISNEIITPMNAIIGMNDMVIKESTERKVVEYSRDLSRAANNLLQMINDMLDFSKIQSGKMNIIEDDYSFRELLEELYVMNGVIAKEKGLSLVFDIDPNIPVNMIGDKEHIKQILDNLLNNAVKYTEKGTVTLKVTLENMGRASAILKFCVKDTGRGIKDEDINLLYEAFDKVGEESANSFEGTGLGVSISSKLLTLMGSELNIESVFGIGSMFFFLLRQSFGNNSPIGEFSGKKADLNASHPLAEVPEAKILVVDDNSLNIKVFQGLMKATGAKITAAYSGKEALEYTREEKFDLIFMDHMMPEMDGLECRRLISVQEGGQNTETPIVALVANAVQGAEEEYKQEGFVLSVFKPTTQAVLNEVLWELLPKEMIVNS